VLVALPRQRLNLLPQLLQLGVDLLAGPSSLSQQHLTLCQPSPQLLHRLRLAVARLWQTEATNHIIRNLAHSFSDSPPIGYAVACTVSAKPLFMRLAACVCQLRYLLQCLHTLPVIYLRLAVARLLWLDASAVLRIVLHSFADTLGRAPRASTAPPHVALAHGVTFSHPCPPIAARVVCLLCLFVAHLP
jgi:hypothetical protein